MIYNNVNSSLTQPSKRFRNLSRPECEVWENSVRNTSEDAFLFLPDYCKVSGWQEEARVDLISCLRYTITSKSIDCEVLLYQIYFIKYIYYYPGTILYVRKSIRILKLYQFDMFSC